MKTVKKMVGAAIGFLTGILLVANLAAAETVNLKTKDGLGTFLTDAKGMTLYLFKKDAPNKSACMAGNGCLERWPLFYAEKIEATAGIDATAFGTITRDDGKLQTTYKGQPLYYYFKDKDDEDAYGQGVNNVWFVVAP